MFNKSEYLLYITIISFRYVIHKKDGTHISKEEFKGKLKIILKGENIKEKYEE